MTITPTQSVNNFSATNSVTLTIATPAVGSLLVLRTYAGAGDQTAMPAPTGYTLACATTATTSGGSAIWWRIADGTEGTSVIVTGVSATYVAADFLELPASLGPWAANPVDVVGTLSGTSGTTATVTAATATSTAAAYVVVMLGLSGSSGGFTGTWTNGFTDEPMSGSRNDGATKQTAAVETPSTTGTWTTARVPRAALAAFTIPSASGTPATATGSVALSGTAAGKAPATATGAIALGGTAAGKAAAEGLGTITLGGGATGAAPAVAWNPATPWNPADPWPGPDSGIAAVTATGTVTLAGTGSAKAVAVATGAIILGGMAHATVVNVYVPHTYVQAPLASNGASVAPLTASASTAPLLNNGASTAPLASNGASTAPVMTTI